MKRYRIVAFILILVMSLTACGKKAGETGQENDAGQPSAANATGNAGFYCSSFLGNNGFATENFALYHSNHGRLQIFDVATGTDIVYCFDAGCEHKQAKRDPMTGEKITQGCIAYEISSNPVMMKGDNLYFLTETGEVMQSDRQGENRKLIGRVPPYMAYGFGDVFFSEDALFEYYVTDQEIVEVKDEDGNSQWMVGDFKDKSTCIIERVSLTDGSAKEIFSVEEYNARISERDIRGDHLYFVYFYLDCPFIGPNLETYGLDIAIPEWLTVENYWEEMPKHQWIDIYDYNIKTDELRVILKGVPAEPAIFCKDFFAVADRDGTTKLYRYDGELFRTLPFKMHKGVRSDSGLVCVGETQEEYLLIDENTGETLKKTTVPYSSFLPEVIIGGSCYGMKDGRGEGYLPADAFWAGDTSKAVAFKYEEE